MKGKRIVVWSSCGAASAVAAKKTLEKYGADNEVLVVNMPIKQEDEDNQRFANDIEKWLGVRIDRIYHPKYKGDAVAVWEDRKYMSGVKGAPCTKILKKDLRHIWTEANKPDFHVLGFTADEEKRHRLFILSEIPNVIPVLIDEGLTKGDCFGIIQEAGIELPLSYRDGMPNANCNACVKATSPTYWNLMRIKRPLAFKERAEQSRRLGVRLVRYKGKRIFLDELPEDAVGRPIKNMNFECGIFCELPKLKS